MCIYTKRLYHCWCVDYRIKFANRCTASLRSDKECPRPAYLTKCEVEKVGLCPFHSHEEAKLFTAGVPNPSYPNTKPEAEILQQAETVAKMRYSDPNPEATSNKRFVEAEPGGENRRSEIRISKTFPQSPPPAAPYRRSDPVLEGRGVPNPWTSLPQTLQRLKSSAQAPTPPPRPESFQQPPSQDTQVQPVGVPNPWILPTQKLQRSKTTVQAPPPPLPQRPVSFQQPPSKPVSIPLPTPLHRSNTTITTTLPHTPIHASHLQRASKYTAPASTSSTSRNAAAKPVQVAIRDERGFFIPPAVYQEPAPPTAPPEPEPEPNQLEFVDLNANIQRSSTYSSSRGSGSSIHIDAQIQRSSTYSSRSSTRDSIILQSENPPILRVRRVSTSPSPSESTVAQNADMERRKSNRVSFVWQKSDDEGEGEEIYPRPLQMHWRDGEVGERGMSGGDREEIRGECEVSAEGEGHFVKPLRPVGMDGERKERRKSIWRQSVGTGMGMPSIGVDGAEEEILYSGSDYDGGEDGEIEIVPVVNRNGGNGKREEKEGRRKSVRMPSPTGVGRDEEEIIYSGSDYDAGEDSDDDMSAGNRNMEVGRGIGKRDMVERGSVLFEMLYAHTSLPQSQFQSQAAAETGLEERREGRERRMSQAVGAKERYWWG